MGRDSSRLYIVLMMGDKTSWQPDEVRFGIQYDNPCRFFLRSGGSELMQATCLGFRQINL